MKKNIIFSLMLMLIGIIFTTNAKISAEELNDLDNLFDYHNYLNEDYGQYENTVQIGKYYKVGVWGHRMVASVGEISLKAYKVQDFVSMRDKGLSSSLTIKDATSYTINSNISAGAQIKYGIVDMIQAIVNIDDIGSVGTNTTLTSEYSFMYNLSYSKTLTNDYEIQDVIDLTQIPDDKLAYSISRVAVYLEMEINYSYTEEQKWSLKNGYYWVSLDDTYNGNYTVRYYIADLTTFCYNDMTFGSKMIGLYPLNVDIKEYD